MAFSQLLYLFGIDRSRVAEEHQAFVDFNAVTVRRGQRPVGVRNINANRLVYFISYLQSPTPHIGLHRDIEHPISQIHFDLLIDIVIRVEVMTVCVCERWNNEATTKVYHFVNPWRPFCRQTSVRGIEDFFSESATVKP